MTESGGFAWFTLQDSEPGNPPANNVNEPTLAVLEWLDTLEYTSVGLFGFSQGAAMSLQLLRHAPHRFAATVALSGFVAAGELPGDAELADARPPVFWGRGTHDRVITDAAIERTESWLPSHSTATTRIYEGMAHSISVEELAEANDFLRANLV
jgi:phospholipase/carboxylesterase